MPSTLPPVAVVVALHNGAAWIRDTLASVRRQTHSPAEILVIDDNSTDDGPAMAAEVPGVSVLPLTLPRVNGAGPGRQQGFQLTTSPFVAFLDQDDLWHPEHLRLLATVLDENPSCPAAVSKFAFFNDDGQPTYSTPRLAPSRLDPWDTFPFNVIMSPSGVLVRRTALDRIGGWPTVGHVTDFLAWYRLSLDTPFIENQSATCGKRAHAGSKTVDTQVNDRATYLHYRAKLLGPVLAERIERRPEESENLRRRIDALSASGVLAEAYDRGEPSLVAKTVPTLESLAANDPESFDRMLDFLFCYHLGPALHGNTKTQRAFLRTFLSGALASAPTAQRRLRTFFLRRIPIRVFLQFLLERPLDWTRWTLGAASGNRAVRVRWHNLRGREQAALV